ncbi:MAG: hypothetical protein HY021_09955 [Burkholderiales bacterium]|nr:hypothetical protein [Burkholderiales bacterium]
MKRTLIAGLAVAAMAWTGPAAAVAIAGPSGTAAQGKKTVVAAPALRNTGGELELINGVVTGVDVKNHTLTVGAQAVGVHPHRLRVLGPNGTAIGNLSAVRSGAHIRFALDPATRDDRKIVLIYIDQQP